MKIYKHILHIVILSEEPDPLPERFELTEVEELISSGPAIGTFWLESTSEVPQDKIQEELLSVGNDGTFFDEIE